MTKTFLRPVPALVAAILAPGLAHAVDFASGGWNGSFDTTLSFGQPGVTQASRSAADRHGRRRHGPLAEHR